MLQSGRFNRSWKLKLLVTGSYDARLLFYVKRHNSIIMSLIAHHELPITTSTSSTKDNHRIICNTVHFSMDGWLMVRVILIRHFKHANSGDITPDIVLLQAVQKFRLISILKSTQLISLRFTVNKVLQFSRYTCIYGGGDLHPLTGNSGSGLSLDMYDLFWDDIKRLFMAS